MKLCRIFKKKLINFNSVDCSVIKLDDSTMVCEIPSNSCESNYQPYLSISGKQLNHYRAIGRVDGTYLTMAL